MDFIKWGQRQVRQFALNLTETEVRVEEATNSDPWGPHGTAMSEIAEESFDPEKYKDIMTTIARRLTDTAENWRHVYKALLLLEYMIGHGPSKVARDTQSNLDVLRDLQRFEFKDKSGRDQGANVRNRAKEIVALISSAEKLAEARDTARSNKDKYKGASNEMARFNSSPPPTDFGQSIPKRVVYEEKRDGEIINDEDPFEATRNRIEKLKAEEKATAKAATAAIRVTLPNQNKREPKKLSQVKVNPEIAATFIKQQHPSARTDNPTVNHRSDTQPHDLLADLNDAMVPQSAETVARTAQSPKAIEDVFAVLTAPVPRPQETTTVMDAGADWADFGSGVGNLGVPIETVQSIQDVPRSSVEGLDESPHAVGTTIFPTAYPTTVASSRDPFESLWAPDQKPERVPMGFSKTVKTQQRSLSPSIVESTAAHGGAAERGFAFTTIPSHNQPSAMTSPPHQSLNVGHGLGLNPVDWTITRPQGAPMNPATMHTQRAALRKEDPFANLGFQ